MKVLGIFDTHWGDSAKAKVAKFLFSGPFKHRVKVAARFNGADNAGNTMNENGQEVIFHNIPISAACPGVDALIAPLCLVSLPNMLDIEMPDLESKGICFDGLRISRETYTVLPWHRQIEAWEENALGRNRRGSTMHGIAPAYRDIAGKTAISVSELLDEKALQLRVEENIAVKNEMTRFRELALEPDQVVEMFLRYGERLKPFVVETDPYLESVFDTEKNPNATQDDIFAPIQAQGALLDIHSPSFPGVSSSGMTTHDAGKTFRLATEDFDWRIGVCKAYTTSVGPRDFPTRLIDAAGEGLRGRGREFGATTGRPRDCGWLDGPAWRHSVLVNKLTHTFVTKLDVLDRESEIPICVQYDRGGEILDRAPRLDLGNCQPVYKCFKGWQRTTAGVRRLENLPSEARAYLDFMQEYSGIPIAGVSTGPDTWDTIWLGF